LTTEVGVADSAAEDLLGRSDRPGGRLVLVAEGRNHPPGLGRGRFGAGPPLLGRG